MTRLLMALVLCGMTGCTPAPRVAEALPEHEWVNASHALEVMAERADAIETLSGRCDVTLEQGGETVVLDGAVAARLPDRLRLRGWKFDRAVMDLTVRGDEVWFWLAEEAESSPDEGALAQIRAGGDRSYFDWPLLVGMMSRTAWDDTALHGSSLIATRRLDDGWTLRMRIHRPTLTVRLYEVVDPRGEVVHRVSLGDYTLIDQKPWPTRITATHTGSDGETRELTIRLSEIALNERLAAGAFDPPDRATRLDSGGR